LVNHFRSRPFCLSGSVLKFFMQMSSFASAGIISSLQQLAWLTVRGRISRRVASTCSMGVMPSMDFSREPLLIFLSSRGMRVMKNSSRLLPQMARNLTLSSRGCQMSCASSNTRTLNRTQLSSRLMK
jgi:hypothetical protein